MVTEPADGTADRGFGRPDRSEPAEAAQGQPARLGPASQDSGPDDGDRFVVAAAQVDRPAPR